MLAGDDKDRQSGAHCGASLEASLSSPGRKRVFRTERPCACAVGVSNPGFLFQGVFKLHTEVVSQLCSRARVGAAAPGEGGSGVQACLLPLGLAVEAAVALASGAGLPCAGAGRWPFPVFRCPFLQGLW